MAVTKYWVLSVVVVALANGIARSESSIDQVINQFRAYCLHESTDHGARLLDDVELPKTSPEQAKKLLSEMTDDGAWGDLDYTSQARSSWPAGTHLSRALGLIVYARRSNTPADESTKCIQAVHKAISNWKQHDYKCLNWWYNDIGVPKMLGNIALLLGKDLTKDEREYIAGTVLARSKVGSMTGQNRVWLASNGVMRAALLSDEQLMRKATAVIQEELVVATGEGIQSDWSFHQHGPQQQFGNYGMAYAVVMSRWAMILRDSPWAFPPEKTATLRDYLLQGQNWVSWRGVMDISACGRQLFPNSLSNKAGVLRGTMRAMAIADVEYANQYTNFVNRNQDNAPNDLTGTRYFWKSDYLIQRNTDTMVTLKMSSSRVIGGETVNSENLSGLHLADGATFFYHSGHEYDDIFPMWDWRMIPGVTSTLSDGSLRWPSSDLAKAPEFVGAVSDGHNACAAMDFHRGELHAKKAWFFVNDFVVCLGADISSNGTKPIVTTINQCLLKGVVTINRNGKSETAGKVNQIMDDAQWVEHDGLRYSALQSDHLHLSTESQTGNWRKVFDSPATPQADVTHDVFKLWIDHGDKTDNASYAYSVTPAGVGKSHTVKIISNTNRLQAIQYGEGKDQFIGVVFWTAGSADLDGMKMKANTPCLLLIDHDSIWVSDPTQKLESLQLDIAGKSKIITLPRGSEAGRSVEVARIG